jgi:hypothetical protein
VLLKEKKKKQKKNFLIWTGSVAQAVGHLLCKCEALSSNPSPTENKSQVPVAHACNPSYSGGKNQEDQFEASLGK